MTIRIDDEGPPGTVTPGPSGITGVTPPAPVCPVSAGYVVMAAHETLTSERILAVQAPLTLADGGAGGNVTLGANAVATPDMLSFPGQSAAIALTVILAGAVAGVYMAVAAIDVSAAAAAGTIDANVKYADSAGATTKPIFSGLTLAGSGDTGGSLPFYHAGGDISVSTSVTGLIGTPTYRAEFRLVRLG